MNTQENENQIKVRGLYLIIRLKLVKEKLGEDGIKRLEKEYGKPLEFSPLKDYPVEDLVKIDQIAIRLIFRKITPESYFEYGKLVFGLFSQTALFKTYFSLFRGDLFGLAKRISQITEVMYPGLKLEVEETFEKTIRLVIKNEPWDINITKGLWTAAIEYLGIKEFNLQSKVLPNKDHEYVLEWQV